MEADDIQRKKQALRQRVRQRSAAISPEFITAASRQITTRVTGLAEYAKARCVMCYVSLPREVQTHELLHIMRQSGKTVVVPWCEGEELKLFRFETLAELTPGALGILEPPLHLRVNPVRQARAEEIDLVLVPGLAFDRRGGRVGRGKGYYDRFLQRIAPSVPKVGLAFEWQLVDEIPVTPHDVRMDLVVTEKNIYPRT